MASPAAKAQLSGYNLMEFQYGNIPFNGAYDYSTAYNMTQLRYNQNSFELAARFEQFYSPFRDREYQQLSQASLRYTDSGFDIKVGQVYDIIGRGILFRTFEIPGAVYEDLAFRSRYAFYRDLSGFSISYTADRFNVKLLRGRPLLNVFPPDESEELLRPDLVEGGQVAFNITPDQTLALTGLQHRPNDSTRNQFAGFFYSAQLSEKLSFYTESAMLIENYTDSFSDDEKPRAIYAALNYFDLGYGLSLEYKHYDRFILGSGFNDPPALIKEHSYPVLNRQTHILFANGEAGWQLEAFKLWEDFSQTTVNLTTLRTFNGLEANYFEVFAEHSQEFDAFSVKVFYDYAHDEPKFQRNRHSGGLALSLPLNEA
jgi:hypothetical protein